MAADGSVVIEIVGDESKFERSLGSLDKSASSALKGLEVIAKAVTVAIGATAAAVVKFGSEFETSMANASTMFGDVAVDTEGLNKQILSLSNASGIAAASLGDSLYNALSAGIPVTEDMGGAMEYMERCTKLAKAGFTDVDTAVTATAKVLNAYGMDVAQADAVQRIMIQTQNKGITTVNELGATLAQVTPTAAAMGVSFETVGAALATMTAQGTPTAQATTQLNSLIAELGKKGTQAAENLDKATEGTKHAGKSFTELMNAGVPLNEVLDLMDGYATKNGKSLIDMFSSIEAGKSALAMAGKNSQKFTDNLAAMSTKADVVGDAYDKVTDTLENKLVVLKESVKNLGITLYENAKGPLKKATQGLTDLANGAAKGLPSALEAISNNFELIATAAKMAIGAIVAFKAASIIGGLVVAYQKAALTVALFAAGQSTAAIKTGISTGALAVHEVAVGVLTGKIGLATAAQGLWNAAMLANPIGVVALAAAALTVAIIGVVSATERGTSAEEEARKATEARNKAIQERAKAWEDGKAAQQESIDASLSEISMAETYIDELRSITDENGRVKAGYEGRAKALYELINEAIPGAISANQDEAGSIYQVSDAIDDVISKKKAEAVLSAMKPQYEAAAKNWIQAQKDEAIAQREVDEARATSIIKLREGIEVVSEEFKKKEATYEAAKEQSKSYYEEMSKYEELLAASVSGNSQQIDSTLARVSTNFKTAANTDVETLQKQVADYEATYKSMTEKVASGNSNITQAQLDTVKKLLDEAKAELQKGLEEQNAIVKNQSASFAPTFAVGVASGSGSVSKAVSNMTAIALQQLTKSKSDFGKAGEAAAQKSAEGIRAQSGNVSDATQAMTDKAKLTATAIAATMSAVGVQMGNGVIVGLNEVTRRVAQTAAAMSLAALVAAKAAVGIHSPSKDFEEQVGAQMVAGAVQGIVKNTKSATKKAEDLSKGILSATSKWVDDRKFFDSLALENEAEFWDQMSKVANLSADDRLEAEKKAFTARENLAKQSYENSKKWIEQEKFYNRLSGEEEIEAWERVVARKNLLTKDQEDAERNLYATKQRLLKEQQDAYDSYLKSVESRANTLRDFTGLFGEVKKETEVSGYQLLQNLRGQVQAFVGWQDDIAKLAEKGISGSLLDELREMGPKAANEIHALTMLSEKQLKEYAGLFEKMGQMATEQAESEIKPVEVPLTLGGLNTQEISAVVDKSASAVCLSISDKTKAFTTETEKIVMAMCDTVLAKHSDFYRVGFDAMCGLDQGLQVSGRSAISTARSIADSIIWEMQRALDIHSPSRKMRDLVGVPTAQGFFVGFEEEMAGLSQKMQAAVNAETSKISITAATQAEGNMARSGVTREVFKSTRTVEKVAQLEGDGVTGELVRMLNLKIKADDRHTGLCLVN